MGIEWRVERPEFVVEDGEECLGSCVERTTTIKVRRDLPRDLAVQTFIHESLHAGLPKDFLTENQVEFVSMVIFQVLRDNKMLR
jgi:hypothetical protein